MFGISEVDKDLVCEYIFLNLLIEKIESDLLLFDSRSFKIREVYQELCRNVSISVQRDLNKIKQEMKDKNIKVYPKEEIDEYFVRYQHSVGRLNSEFRFFKAAIDMHLREREEKYFNMK